MTNTTLIPARRRPAALRVILQWIFGERALRGPAAIELDVLEQQANRAVRDVEQRAVESTAIEAQLEHARQHVHAALTDAVSPGVITAEESRALCGELIDLSLGAHTHTQNLKDMV